MYIKTKDNEVKQIRQLSEVVDMVESRHVSSISLFAFAYIEKNNCVKIDQIHYCMW